MSPPHRWSRHIPPNAPGDAHSPGYWTAGHSGYESPRGASGRLSLAYASKTSITTTWTISPEKTVDYVFRSRITRRRNWSAYPNWSSIEPEMEHGRSLRMEEPGAPKINDDRYIGDDPYRTIRGPSYCNSRSPEYSRPRSWDRTYSQEGYNSIPSRSQGHHSQSYSSGEESDHESSKHRHDKNSSQTKFESGHGRNRSHYSDDRSLRNEYESDAKIRNRRRDRNYGRSNEYEPVGTSKQTQNINDSGRSRKYEPDYKTGSRHWNEDNSRSNKYKPEPRYEKVPPRTPSTIDGDEEELPNYYAMLGISSFASSHEIKRAAKLKRVEVHPDKNIKPDMLESEKAKAYEIAAAVGQAADVLTDGELRSQYDKKLARQWTL